MEVHREWDVNLSRGSLNESTAPFVSIVLPCFNSRNTIGDCLTSLEAQTYPSEQFEIIAVDNGSTDKTDEWITEHFPRIQLIRVQQKGSGYARNAGFAASKGQWVLSIDSDCVAAPNWISTLIRAMQQAPPETAAIGGKIMPYSRKTLVERYQPAWVSQPDVSKPGNRVHYTATPNAIFNRARVREAGGFDGTAGHDDTDLGIRLEASGYKVLMIDDAIVLHRNPVTLSELYSHRLKYGERNFILACKHPGILDDPTGASKRRRLFRETAFRIFKDTIKLPLSVAYRPKSYPMGWPLVDAVMAWGNYRGFVQASRRAEISIPASN